MKLKKFYSICFVFFGDADRVDIFAKQGINEVGVFFMLI